MRIMHNIHGAADMMARTKMNKQTNKIYICQEERKKGRGGRWKALFFAKYCGLMQLIVKLLVSGAAGTVSM